MKRAQNDFGERDSLSLPSCINYLQIKVALNCPYRSSVTLFWVILTTYNVAFNLKES